MGKPIVPGWIKNRLIQSANKDRKSMFLSDKGAFDESFQAKLDLIMNNLNQALPMQTEAFNANLASRGVFASGEGVTQFYQNVVGPLQRTAQLQATSAAAETSLGFANLQSGERIAGEQLNMASLNELVQAIMADEEAKNKPGMFEKMLSDLIGTAGEAAGTYLGKKL